MPKIDLGEKQLCPSCGAKFYDLNKRPAKCPKCANTFDPDDELIVATRIQTRMAGFEPDETSSDDDDDLEVGKIKPVDIDTDEEEIMDEEVTKEIDIENIDDGDLIMGDDGDDEGDLPVNSSDPIPEGFSEQELDEDDPTAGDDEIPFLEDDDEFLDEELEALIDGDDDDDPNAGI